MKRFARASLITAGILFLTGTVILIICSIFAGGMRSVLADTVSTELHSTINGNILSLWSEPHHHSFNDSFPIHSGHHTDDNAANASNITELCLDLTYVDFTLAPSQDDCFHITTEGRGKYQYYTEGSTFYVDGFFNRSTANINKLTLEIPDINYTSVDIDFGAGTANLAPIKSDTLTIDLGAGELTIESADCNDITADVGAGSILIKNSKTENADFDIGMGQLIYQGYINADLNADVGMGNITLQMKDSLNSHNYDLEGSMGFITLGSKEYSGMAFEKEFYNGADSNYSLECGMGSISVTFEDIDEN